MILRILFITIILFNFSNAAFQQLRVGKIDNYYKNKITEDELINIIDEIEYFLESQLNVNVFDYSNLGKDINIVYVPPSKLEKRILYSSEKLKKKEEQIKKLPKSFPKQLKDINTLKKIFKKQNNLLTKRTKTLNDYIHSINRKKSVTKKEYKEIQSYIKKEKSKLHKELKKLKKEESYIKSLVNKYNNKVRRYNNLTRQYNTLNSQLEVMTRSFKKVKGMTFGVKEIKRRTFYKDGKRVNEKTVRQKMNKIDIYGFDSLKELKTILTHEILHLVGIPHINIKNALMNPVVQKNQIEKMTLTNADIRNFHKNF